MVSLARSVKAKGARRAAERKPASAATLGSFQGTIDSVQAAPRRPEATGNRFSVDVAIAFAFGFIISLYALMLFNQSNVSSPPAPAPAGVTAFAALSTQIVNTQYTMTILVLGVLLVIAGLQVAQLNELRKLPLTAVRKNVVPATPENRAPRPAWDAP